MVKPLSNSIFIMSNTKRIARNTVVLYARMAVVLLITLYTSRVILKSLGVADFGLYGVVGGVVGLFAFLKTSMGKATQRFLNVEMVKESGDLKMVFRASWTIHIIVAVIILILAETIGLWFFNSKVNIPEGREIAANIVYQTTMVSLCISMLEIPFSADIVAHEKMTFYAVVSVIDAVLKLSIAFLLLFHGGDRLALYGILMMCISFFNVTLYYIYCRRKFVEISLRLTFGSEKFKPIFSYVGWTLMGQTAIVGCNHGNVILVNVFHSVLANAAMTIGTQVSSAVNNLASNFQIAFNPQITKSYAERNWDYLKFLVFTTSKLSYCLLFVVALPIAVNIDWILDVWLDIVPEKADVFCILCMVNGILNALSAPLNFSVMASGKIKWFQIVTSVVYLSDLLVVYALFKMGAPSETVMYVKVSVMLAILFVRLYFSHHVVPGIGLRSYVAQVMMPLMLVSIGSIVVAFLVVPYFSNVFLRLFLTSAVVLFEFVMIWFVGLNKKEKQALVNIIKRNKYVGNL